MSILSVFRKKKKKQGGVIITIDPSQTTTTPTSKETAYIDSSGKMVVVGTSQETPSAGTPTRTTSSRVGGGRKSPIPPVTTPTFIDTTKPEELPSQLIGVEDETTSMSRLPTKRERIDFAVRARRRNLDKGEYVYKKEYAKPFLEVRKTPTYKDYIKDKNPITATMNYGANKAFAFMSRGEVGQPFFGSPDVQKVGIPALEVGSFFIPYVGSSLAVSSGIAQFTTKGGRTEIKETFKDDTFKGTILTAGSVLAVGGGTFKLVKEVSKAKNLPKYDVKIASQDTNVIQSGEGILVESNTAAKVTKKGLFGNSESVVALRSVTEVGDTSEDLIKVKTFAQGVQRNKKGLNLATGKEVYSKPESFVGGAKGVIKEEDVILQMGQTEKELKVQSILFAGKTQSGKKVSANFLDDLTLKGWKLKGSRKPNTFLGGGISLPIKEKLSLYYSKSANVIERKGKYVLDKTGRTTTLGILKGKADDTLDFGNNIITKQKMDKTQLTENIAKSIDKAIISNRVNQPSTSFKAITKASSIVTPSNQLTSYITPTRAKSLYYGTGQYERTEETISLLPKFAESNMLGSSYKFLSGTSVISRSRERTTTRKAQSSKTNQRELQRTNQRELQKVAQGLKQKLSQKQTQRYSNIRPSNRYARMLPRIFPVIIFDRKKGRTSKPIKLKRSKTFKTKYTPSFTASVFKIGGKTPKKLIGDGYSPFIRPL